MKLSALYLSIQRLEGAFGRQGNFGGANFITQIPTSNLDRVRLVSGWEHRTLQSLETTAVPSLEDAIAGKKLTQGMLFTHLGSFIGNGIIDAADRFNQGKPLKKEPLFYAKLDGASRGARIEMLLHPENFPSASSPYELSSRGRFFALGRITDEHLPNLTAQALIIGYLYDEPEVRGMLVAPADRLPSAAGGAERKDIFLSHASEDKDTIARPLYDALREVGLTVWFDEAELNIGDRLRRKIDEGLAHCAHGVVIISPSVLS